MTFIQGNQTLATSRDCSGKVTTCSDFAQNDNNTFYSLEVGIITKFPLANVVEFDQSPDNTGAPGEPEEEQLVNVGVPGIANVNAARGLLTADISDLGITLVVTHLKSSQSSAGSRGSH